MLLSCQISFVLFDIYYFSSTFEPVSEDNDLHKLRNI